MEGEVSDQYDEYHESKEDLTSASSSDSLDDEQQGARGDYNHRKKVQNRPAMTAATISGQERPPLWSSSSNLNSKFAVWKDNPGSIQDRRQRFFQQMGFKNLRGEHRFGHGFGSLSKSVSRPDPEIKDSDAAERLTVGRDITLENEHRIKTGQPQNGVCTNEDAHRNGAGPSPEFELSSIEHLAESNGVDKKDRSLSDKLVSMMGDTQTCAVSLSGPLQDPSEGSFCQGSQSIAEHNRGDSLSRTSGITPEGIPSCGEVGARAQMSYKSSPSPLRKGSKVWNDASEELEPTHQHQKSSSLDEFAEGLQVSDGDPGVETIRGNGILMQDEGSKGAVYRIRDLDSGKEFVVDEFGTDGTLEKFKDVDTGKELTLEEFESSLGLYPVMQELKRREREADRHLGDLNSEQEVQTGHVAVVKKKGWLRNIKGAILPSGLRNKLGKQRDGGYQSGSDEREGSSKGRQDREGTSKGHDAEGSHRDGDDRDASSRGGLRSGSATDENSDSAPTWKKPQRIKVRLHHKSYKQLSELHLGQEIEAHQGAIWTMKFSPDGRYLASAGQDKVVHVWEVIDHPSIADSVTKAEFFKLLESDGVQAIAHLVSSESSCLVGGCVGFGADKTGRGRGGILENGRSEAVLGYKPGKTSSGKRRSGDLSNKVPYPKLFWLSNKAMCSFRGHTEDVLDLSWSRTQFLLSSSMDKTVRLWHISYEGCLRTFSHNDYVTCIQFNPVDEFYFLSGALDDKVRIWSIADHQVVDWTDLGEMVTAVCYTPDGKRAIVGSYKGTCRYFNTAGNKLQLEAHIDVRNDRKKKARGKKITGLQCMPGNPSKVLVTSNDSRIRVYDDLEMISKYKGLRNVNSQISASFCGNGEVIVSASEDSRVYVWNSGILHPSTKSVWKDRKRSCEEFYCHHVSVAIPWPGGSPGFSLSAPGSETPGRSVRSGSEGFVSPSRDDPHDIHESPSFDENRPIGKSSSRDEILGSQKQSLREGCPAGMQLSPESPAALSSSSAVSPTINDAKGAETDITESQNGKLDIAESELPGLDSMSLAEADPLLHASENPNFLPGNASKGSSLGDEKQGCSCSRSASESGLARTASEGSVTSGRLIGEASTGGDASPAADAGWGLVIVTGSLGGRITTFQNYGLPVRF